MHSGRSLTNNQLTGPIPEALGACRTALVELGLYKKQLARSPADGPDK